MNLLADEGVDKPIVDLLRNNGFDVVYILKTNHGADDEFILAMANADGRILLTQDKDFGELVFRLKNAHYGVILIRLEGYKPALKAEIVLNMLIKHDDELIKSLLSFSRMQSELENSFIVLLPFPGGCPHPTFLVPGGASKKWAVETPPKANPHPTFLN